MAYPKIRKSQHLVEKMEHYGIEHLSVSSINSYIDDPAKWVLQSILKYYKDSPALWRGKTVEAVMTKLIKDKTVSLDKSLENAAGIFKAFHDHFLHEVSIDISDRQKYGARLIDDRLRMFLTKKTGEIPVDFDENVAEELEFTMECVKSGYEFFRAIPSAVLQERISYDLGIEIEAIGYIDIVCPDYIIELKTSKRMPSEYDSLRNSVKRQGALYSAVKNLPCKIVYLGKPTKDQKGPKAHQGIKTYDLILDERESLVDELKMSARAMRRLLMVTDSIDEITEIVFPNYDNFFWSDEDKEIAREIWKFEREAA